jgi:nicotinamide-nucleotide amidase
MRAEIVSIGTELLLGTITDTNAAYLAQRLAALGIDCYYVSQVGDNLGRLVDTLTRGWERSDLIVTTGGLGPTGDDLTREAISEMLGERMEVDSALEANLRAFFTRRGVEMPETNLKQATLISSARVLPNPIGTAPGWWVTRSDDGRSRSIVSMPGVPYEMRRMWEHEVEPKLRAGSTTVIVSRTLKVLGLGESVVEDKVRDLMAGSNPTLAPYAKPDGVHLRITAKAQDVRSATPLIESVEDMVRSRLGDAIYGADDETPQRVVRGLLKDLEYDCCLVEIGGSVAGALVPLVGSGDTESPAVECVSVGTTAELGLFFGSATDWTATADLREVAIAAGKHTGATVVLLVAGRTSPIEAGSRIVMADVEGVVVAPNEQEERHATRVHQTWRTDANEVRRLAGLSAMNLLRLRLLKEREHGS